MYVFNEVPLRYCRIWENTIIMLKGCTYAFKTSRVGNSICNDLIEQLKQINLKLSKDVKLIKGYSLA